MLVAIPSDFDLEQRMPRVYIIGFDPSDPSVVKAVNRLNSHFEGQVDLAFIEQDGAWPGMAPGTHVYLVAHSSPFTFNEYNNPADLIRDMNVRTGNQFGDRIGGSDEVVLLSCSAAGVPVRDDHFAAKNFAENFQERIRRPVTAAVGPVDPETLRVTFQPDAYTRGSEDGWFRWDGSGGPVGHDPFDGV
jgi:hypothetical protein